MQQTTLSILMSARKQQIMLLVDDFEEATGKDAPRLPEEAFTCWDDATIRAYLHNPTPPPIDLQILQQWAPALRTYNPHPSLNVLCFHSAGCAEDIFTGIGTGARRMSNVLTEWCSTNNVQCIALQLPGRALRHAEPAVPSMQALAQQLLPVLMPLLQPTAVPYVVVAHSMGCWAAYELLCLTQQRGLMLPQHVVFSCMPAPCLPVDQRPWTPQHMLTDAQFQEECRGWDPDPVIFTPSVWQQYVSMLRNDFSLFDQYTYTHEGIPPPLGQGIIQGATLIWATEDGRVTRDMVMMWESCLQGAVCKEVVLHGKHMCVLHDRTARTAWMESIIAVLQQTLDDTKKT